MPRVAVKLSPTPEAPPDWWADAFRTRQATLRTRLLARLPKIGRPVTATEVRQNILNTSYGMLEIRHALDGLTDQGALRRFERTEPNAYGAAMTRIVTYYELTEQA